MKLDPLTGTARAAGSTPLELATMADMAAEIGSRENSQPAIFIYDHGDGRWPCRLGPNVRTDTLRKMAKILMTVAEQRREMEVGRAEADPEILTPWGVVLRRTRNWSGKRDRVLVERNFEIRLDQAAWPWLPFAVGVFCGLLLAAAAKFVFTF